VSGFCLERHPDGPLAMLIRRAATGWLIRIAADGTCQVWRGKEVWQSDSLNGITLHQLAQIPGGGDFYLIFYPKRQRSRVEMLYLLVTAANWSSRLECASSFPNWLYGFDSRRPLHELERYAKQFLGMEPTPVSTSADEISGWRAQVRRGVEAESGIRSPDEPHRSQVSL
jgi:hypothetical protein